PPSSGFFYYVVEVIPPQPCNATRKAGTHNSSRSNRTPNLSATGVKEVRGNIKHMAVYPNPNQGIFNLTFELKEKENVMIRIFDMQGRMITIERIDNFVGRYNEQIDLSKESPGIYHLQVISESGILNKPIVIE
ncbi:MAG: T9SS type A sorting domain-containing protein, partial [Bacteroidales bacterium]|nr:T9SS type A sorting domain-containing protein [Bacteroidales bacterium]